MFCKNCGKIIGENDLFCTACGWKVTSEAGKEPESVSREVTADQSDYDKHRESGIIICVMIAAAIFICLFIAILLFLNRPQAKFNRYLSIGEKYLDDMEYDEAILEFQKAIDIDPSSIVTYKNMISAYAIAVEDNIGNLDRAAEYYNEVVSMIANASSELSNRQIQILEKELNELIPESKYSEVIKRSKAGKKNTEPEEINNTSGAMKMAEEIASESVGIPFTGDKQYRLRYYPNSESNYSWSITYPDEDKILVHADQNDYDFDGKDEILAILLERKNDTGSFLLEMIEEENGIWNIEDILELETDVYYANATQERADLFFQENNGQIVFFKEEYGYASSFGDGMNYNLEGWIYDGNSFISKYPKMETAGSDGTAEAILDMDPGYYTPEDYEYEYIMDGINRIRSMNFNPVRLGLEYPICVTGGCELLVRIRRKDDSDRWIYDINSPYGFILDPDGYLGNIDLIIDNNEHPRRKKQ